MPKVFSVGYSTANAREYVKILMKEPGTLLIDTRLSPRSWRADWTVDALREEYGARYRQAGQFLGNLNFQGGPVKIKNPVLGIKGLIRYLHEGHDLILLCQCSDYAACHRKVIAELLLEQMPEVEVKVFGERPSPSPILINPVQMQQAALFEVPTAATPQHFDDMPQVKSKARKP